MTSVLTDELQCSALSDSAVSCVKPLYRSSGGEIWDHAGGHVFASRETMAKLDTWHYDAGALLAGEATTMHAPQDCPGIELCTAAPLLLNHR